MSTPHTSASTAVALVMLLLLPRLGHGESQVGNDSASTSVRLQVIVQPYVRILRNAHPLTVASQGSAVIRAEQQLSISTNQRDGFCLDLVPAATQIPLRWQLQSISGGEVQISPHGDGYRLCGARNGSYALTLTHVFGFTQPDALAQAPWPVVTALTQL